MTESPTRLMVTHRSPLVGDALARKLAATEGFRVTAVVSHPAAAPGALRTAHADLLLADVTFGAEVLGTLCRSIADDHPSTEVLLLGEAAGELFPELIESGALAWVPGNRGTADLVAALRDSRRGEVRWSMDVASRIAERIRFLGSPSAPPLDTGEPLTTRERQILERLAEGLANKEIARRLDIRVSTVKNHVHRILSKLHVARRRDATREAYLRGILRKPPTDMPSA